MARATAAAPQASGDAAPLFLVVAREEADRRRLADVLASDVPVRTLSPRELLNPAPLVDAAGAVVLLGKGATSSDVEQLTPLLAMPAARSLLLLMEDAGDEALEVAMARLRPDLILPHPVPPAVLRLALRRLVPAGGWGEGARSQHRRASALLGVSGVIHEVLQLIKQVAPTQIPVLILGETGTGKELVARAIHQQSPRAGHPFVAVNCSALPDSLLEAELFGACRGAYTGADRDRHGLFLEASGGTLFLDEIGDTSPAFQAKLLRAIETQEIRPLGGTQVHPVDVRIVSATHRDLEAAIAEGAFRRDLLYRLNTVTIHVPPLRRRRVDIPFLAQHFAEEFGEAHARRIVLGEDFLEALSRQEFPGNVRELRNAVERVLALASPEGRVTAEHLQLGDVSMPGKPPAAGGSLRQRIEQVEIEAIREALAQAGGNRTRAARALGISRLGLREKMRRLGLETPPRR